MRGIDDNANAPSPEKKPFCMKASAATCHRQVKNHERRNQRRQKKEEMETSYHDGESRERINSKTDKPQNVQPIRTHGYRVPIALHCPT